MNQRVCIITLGLIFVLTNSNGQLCTDPSNVIYGLTNAGFIHTVNVNTGAVGPAINPAYAGNPPSQSNGIGYNPVNGKFYYFKRMPNLAPSEFVSFDPATNAVVILSSPATVNAVFIGCTTPNGSGFYCWDSQARLFYYNIAANTWTLITSSIVDQFGKDVDSIFRLHGSGDAAIDGNGNMLMLPSSALRYGLFRLNAPLPTTAVASVSVTQMIAMKPPPSKFIGIALNNAGQIYMNASNDGLYRLEDDFSLTFMSTLTLAQADLTSCNFPMAMLPFSEKKFSAVLKNKEVLISWENMEEKNVKSYVVEHSINSVDWKSISSFSENKSSADQISDVHNNPGKGKNYYRLRIEFHNNTFVYSSVRSVMYEIDVPYSVWPNPVNNQIWIRNENKNKNAVLSIIDESGRQIMAKRLTEGTSNVEISSLPSGRYFVRIQSLHGENYIYRIVKK